VETVATARLSDRPAFKASASGRRMASRWVTTSDKRARHEETVTDRWAPRPVISKRKINFKIKFHRGKIARGDKNSRKICGGRTYNLKQLL
jgi:hypothetical protein